MKHKLFIQILVLLTFTHAALPRSIKHSLKAYDMNEELHPPVFLPGLLERGPKITDFIPGLFDDLERIEIPGFMQEPQDLENELDLVKFEPTGIQPHQPNPESDLLKALEEIAMPRIEKAPEDSDTSIVSVKLEPINPRPHRKPEMESELEEALDRIEMPGITNFFPGLIEDLEGINMPKFVQEPEDSDNGIVSVKLEPLNHRPHVKLGIESELDEALNGMERPGITDFFPALIENLEEIRMPKFVQGPEDSDNGIVSPRPHQKPNIQSRLEEALNQIETPGIIDFIPGLMAHLEGVKMPKFVQDPEDSDSGIVSVKLEPINHRPHKKPEIESELEEALDRIKMPGIPDFIPGLIEDLVGIKTPEFEEEPEDSENGIVSVKLEPNSHRPHKKPDIQSRLQEALKGIADFPGLIEDLMGIELPEFVEEAEDSDNGLVVVKIEPIEPVPDQPELEHEIIPRNKAIPEKRPHYLRRPHHRLLPNHHRYPYIQPSPPYQQEKIGHEIQPEVDDRTESKSTDVEEDRGKEGGHEFRKWKPNHDRSHRRVVRSAESIIDLPQPETESENPEMHELPPNESDVEIGDEGPAPNQVLKTETPAAHLKSHKNEVKEIQEPGEPGNEKSKMFWPINEDEDGKGETEKSVEEQFQLENQENNEVEAGGTGESKSIPVSSEQSNPETPGEERSVMPVIEPNESSVTPRGEKPATSGLEPGEPGTTVSHERPELPVVAPESNGPSLEGKNTGLNIQEPTETTNSPTPVDGNPSATPPGANELSIRTVRPKPEEPRVIETPGTGKAATTGNLSSKETSSAVKPEAEQEVITEMHKVEESSTVKPPDTAPPPEGTRQTPEHSTPETNQLPTTNLENQTAKSEPEPPTMVKPEESLVTKNSTVEEAVTTAQHAEGRPAAITKPNEEQLATTAKPADQQPTTTATPPVEQAVTTAKPQEEQPATTAKPQEVQPATIAKPEQEQPATEAKPEGEQLATIAKTQEEQPATAAKPEVEQSATVAKPEEKQPAAIAKPQDEQPATTAKPENELPTTPAKPENEQPATTAKPENEQSATTAKSDEEQAAAKAKPQEEQSATTAKPENELPATTAKPDEEQPETTAKPENEQPATTAKPEQEQPATEAKPEGEQPAAIAKPQEEQPATTAKPEVEQSATAAKPEEKQPAAKAKPQAEQPATTAKPENEQPATTAKPENEQPTTTAKPENEQPTTTAKPEEAQSAAKAKPQEEQPTTIAKPEEEQPVSTAKPTIIAKPANAQQTTTAKEDEVSVTEKPNAEGPITEKPEGEEEEAETEDGDSEAETETSSDETQSEDEPESTEEGSGGNESEESESDTTESSEGSEQVTDATSGEETSSTESTEESSTEATVKSEAESSSTEAPKRKKRENSEKEIEEGARRMGPAVRGADDEGDGLESSENQEPDSTAEKPDSEEPNVAGSEEEQKSGENTEHSTTSKPEGKSDQNKEAQKSEENESKTEG